MKPTQDENTRAYGGQTAAQAARPSLQARETQDEVDALRAQRDELAAALSGAANMLEMAAANVINPDVYSRRAREARAALAKVNSTLAASVRRSRSPRRAGEGA
jgi:hypothetical protein